MDQNNQNEFSLNTGLESQTDRKTARHLPSFFRTDANKKFLGGTLDPITQPGKLTRINSYIGRRDIPNYSFDDNYEEEISNARQYYQLEPSFVYDDAVTGNVNWYADYNDYMNSLKYFGAFTGNHSNLNKSEAYSWDPNIDWDKLVNFQNYYWLPNGPDPITIYGENESITSTYTITSRIENDNTVYVFSPNGLTATPVITLYRGQTYNFNLNAKGAPFCIKTRLETDTIYLYKGFYNQLVETGTVEFTVPFDAPSVLYYMNSNDVNSAGIIEIRDLNEAAVLNVELDIIGKKTYTSAGSSGEIISTENLVKEKSYFIRSLGNADWNKIAGTTNVTYKIGSMFTAATVSVSTGTASFGVEFINGLKIKFSENVLPEKYASGYWYVEGVGDKIKLINAADLDTPATYGSLVENTFDSQPFDSQPFEIAENYPKDKDYIVINRASKDRNIWSRNNRWFHTNVINLTADTNKQDALFDQTNRAIRPIIEFSPNLKLFNNGWIAKKDVDLVDTTTTDVFSTIEGSTKFFIDEVQLYPGYRILFTADPDPLVSGRIFKVTSVFNSNLDTNDNSRKYQISLQSVDDSDPSEGEVVYVTKGTTNKGNSFYYQNGKWMNAQKKNGLNQSPLFDLYDESYNSFSDSTFYNLNNFTGNKIFSYNEGTGLIDSELGFQLSYRSIQNTGDIQFSFDLQKQSWTYQNGNILSTVNSYSGFLRKLNDDNTFSYLNGWVRTYKKLEQPVVRVLKVTTSSDLIPIDVYDNSANISGLSIRVYLNDVKLNSSNISFEIIQGYYYIRFSKFLSVGDKVVYKVYSTMNKNAKGYYEIPNNWQNNPLNETIDLFTYGEVIDHVRSMTDNISSFIGTFPGKSNLANIGDISHYGQRFLQHSGSMPLSVFVITDKHANIIKALRYASRKYTEFKKEFIRLATITPVDGTPADIVDSILTEYASARYYDLTPFYYSDMAAAGAASIRNYIVEDPRFPVFVIDSIFTPMTMDKRQILIYLNDIQLIYDIDYRFDTTDAFVTLLTNLSVGDRILIKDYSNTDGRSYIPYTPSKLGLYPSYVPRIYIDDTYTVPTNVIQGHDGSIIKAYGDYRDDLILELERRIFNSRKVNYDPLIFDINEVLGGYYRKTDFAQDEINNLLSNDFLKWNSIADLDISSNDYYEDENTFTYNYNNSLAPSGNELLPGYWRGVYKYFYDTDRPHTCPWEMQGFTIKPVWWDEVYGEAPYTNENKILWDNIEKGIIADPSSPKTNPRYARVNLNRHIPVDSEGKLLSPLDSNLALNFSLINGKGEYVFGDQAPVETVWRRSSEFPYAIVTSLCILRGAEFIGKMWDRFRVKRNIAGQIYYTETGFKLQTSKLVYPNKTNSNDLTSPVSVTSGLVNFIEEYLFELKSTNIDLYKDILTNLNAKLAYRMSGFTSKEQINVLLDSRSPNATGTVFLPKENYKIFYNKSSPVNSITYSGVIIEKMGASYPQWISGIRYHADQRVVFQGDIYHCVSTHISDSDFNYDIQRWNKEAIPKTGYKIRGYDREKNYFEIFGYRNNQNDITINVGGISDSYTNWSGNSVTDTEANSKAAATNAAFLGQTPDAQARQIYYPKGQIVKINDQYYRSIIGHTASSSFTDDIHKWAPLSKLPIVGGVSVKRRTRFGDNVLRVNYGTIFSSIQSVVDFLLGYQKRLEILGFVFDDYNKELDVPLTWLTSAKEFMFWTLQNWSSGAVITLSPSANKIKFIPAINASVDNTDTDFYDYSIFKADGTPLKSDLTNTYREGSGFIIKPGVDSSDGIFHIKSNLVYKEHVLLFDNVSIFNDTLYDKVPGYRQGRLKLVGYKTTNWDGGYTSPGFMYDEAIINYWKPNTDYMIGDMVKYKNYYFTAPKKILSDPNFNSTDWKQLTSAPVAGLIPNFDYRVEQFRDFYSLDSSNFNSTQDVLARHLVGYQPRQYLANIINDDVAQFKFYQGFIKEKGTRNSVDKLFDVLRSSNFARIDIKEEWAFKIGEYGSTDAYTEIEFPLDEKKYLHNSQNINLTPSPQNFSDLSIYNVTANDISIKPSNYNSNPFKTKKIDTTDYNYGIFKYQVAGYVMDEDVDHIVINESALLNYDISLFKDRDKIWLGYTSNDDWNVYEYLNTNIIITGWTISDNIISLECNVIPDINVDDIVIISNLDVVDGSYKVQSVYNNIIEIYTFNSTIFSIQDNLTSGVVHVLKSSRFKSLAAVSANRYNTKDIRDEIIWVDSDTDGKWLVLKNQDVFNELETKSPALMINNQKYGYDVKVSENKQWMYVSAIANSSGIVYIYNRPSNAYPWQLIQALVLPSTYLNTITYDEKFGISIDATADGSTLVIGSTDVNNLRTVTTANGIKAGKESGTPSGLTDQGIVAVYVYNSVNTRYELDIIISSYTPTSNEKFGSKVKIANDGTNLWLFVSSKNYNSDRGRVQIFRKTNSVWVQNSLQTLSIGLTLNSGDMFGYDLDCTSGANLVAVSMPFRDEGAVYVFKRESYSFTLVETINATTMNDGLIPNTIQADTYLHDADCFGYSIAINDTSLFVSCPNDDTKGYNVGSIYIFNKISSDKHGLAQHILPPIINTSERFGNKLSINSSNNLLAVSAQGGDSIIPLTFDCYLNRVFSNTTDIPLISGTIEDSETTARITGITDTSSLFIGMTLVKTSGTGIFGGIARIKSIDSLTQITITTETDCTIGSLIFKATGVNYSYELDPNSRKISEDGTTFDNNSLKFYDTIPYTGAVYVYNRFDDNFIYADRLRPVNDLESYDNFGSAISVNDSTVSVGTPSRVIGNISRGTVFTFDYNELSWKIKQSQDSLIDISKFKKAFIYNTKTNSLIENLDFYDPAKGKLPAIAEQELKFQTYYDPAIYQYGVDSEVSVDESMPWTDDHIGELWWDLSKVKFTWYEQGDSTFRNNNWGNIFPGCTVDIYEWVETTYLPSRWAELADTEAGLTLGISGIPKDIDNFTWSSKFKYDPISGNNTTLYYYWVKDKKTVPNILSRTLSCADVAALILDPKSQGYQYVSITSQNSLSLSNIKNKLIDDEISLNLQFYEVDNTELLTHREFVLIANDDSDAFIPKILENKWFDSLVGSNTHGQSVPDFKLSTKQRYGNLNSPRQSWFINRYEALKQIIEYVNSILRNQILVDSINFSNLKKSDIAPTLNSLEIDKIIDVLYELKFIGTTRLKTTKISIQQILNGKISKIIIDEMGYGYGRNRVYSSDNEGNPLSWYGPLVSIVGVGKGGVIQTEIDNVGRVINAYIVKSGEGYDDSTVLIVRDYKVLVKNDEESNNSWSIQSWNPETKDWTRAKTQSFDVTRYWKYVDWYKPEYGLTSDISYEIERTVDLNGLPAKIGDIVKINNVGYGDWLLLERLYETNSLDFTEDYRVVGRENGTIQFSDKLYNLNQSLGFDNNYSFDLSFYDQSSSTELRIILETLRDNILVGDLRLEYINLFFNSVYYVLSEQLYTDWCFKTSFLKINHIIGSLKPRITFKSDEVSSYESFLEEAKPYKTKIREWVSTYQLIENSETSVTDFDLPSYYDNNSNTIERSTILTSNINEYPWKYWLDNNAYKITDIVLVNGGTKYLTNPVVIISGTGMGAKASAYVANGSVYKIVVTEPGSGYTTTPTVIISGGNGTSVDSDGNVTNDTGGIRATAYAILGNGLVRTSLIGMKFDRYSHTYSVDNFKHTDFFTGTGNKTSFKLTFAPEIEKNKFIILIDNIEYYGSQYEVILSKSSHDTYKALDGYIKFTEAPVSNSVIEITYHKNIELYSAADRINYAYNPTTGQYGKDLGQLMTGVDYSGVTITSIDFDVGCGWDVLPWDVNSWDNVVSSNDDYIVSFDGSTRSFTLPYIPVIGEIINIYVEKKVSYSTLVSNIVPLNNTLMIPVYDSSGVRLGDNLKVRTSNLVGGVIVDLFRFSKVVAINDDTIILDREVVGTLLFKTNIEFSRTVTTRVDDNDIQNSFVGDGVHNIINISVLVPLAHDDLIIFRKSTSDGALLPTDRSLIDSMISGGNFTSVLGINPEDISIDGDGFVTSDTSHGPEELVQGNVFDTLDLKVYHTPSSGGPNVYINNYTSDGIKSTFNISHIPGTSDGVIVLVGNMPVAHSVNFLNKTITLSQIPPLNAKISVMIFDTGGYDILDKATYVSDGTTIEYTTAANYVKDNITAFVTINGIEVGATIKATNNKNSMVIVRLNDIPAIDSVIQIMIFSGNIEKYSKVTTESIDIVIGKTVYNLSTVPGLNQPLSSNVFVEVDGKYLTAPDYQNFVYTVGEDLPIIDPRYLPNSLLQSDINVYLDGKALQSSQEFNFNSSSNIITLGDGVGKNGDEIIVEIVKRNDFFILNNQLTLTGSFDTVNHNTIKITTFTNHNILKTKRSNKGFTFLVGFDLLGYDSFKYDLSSNAINTTGIFDLPRTVSNTSGIFVLLTRKILSPNIDFILLDNMNQIKVALPNNLKGDDYIEIFTTNDQTVHPSFGFKIFKDMMNRNSYKALDNNSITELAQDLNFTDTVIKVKDGTRLMTVNNSKKSGNTVYGLIEINGELIEYFIKDGNTLSQLRRGRFGTSVNTLVPADTKVYDNSLKLNIPYSDSETKKIAYGDGITQNFDFDINGRAPRVTTLSNSEFYLETLDLNGNWYRKTTIAELPTTAGNFVVGKVYSIQSTGNLTSPTDFIAIGASSNDIGVKFKATGVGRGTGRALLVEYPSIPVNFGQCDEIEVFVAGRRLTKIPTFIYDQNTGQDSYNGAGDLQKEAGFSVDGVSKLVRLTVAPNAGERVLIISNCGHKWQENTENLPFVYSSSSIAKFVTTKHVDLPK